LTHGGFCQILLRPVNIVKKILFKGFLAIKNRTLGMGLTNASASYPRPMNHIFKPFISDFAAVYLDDSFVYSITLDNHVRHLQVFFKVLKAAKFDVSLPSAT
jgi:hypothetical protein